MSTHSESCSVGLLMPLTMGLIPMGVLWIPVRMDTMQYSYIRSDNLIIKRTPTPVLEYIYTDVITVYAKLLVAWILWIGFCCLDFIWCLDFNFHAVGI